MTYIIGDVHGEFQSLLNLVEKIPKDSTLIFVGDLVDRGLNSKEVIDFVKKNNYQCVLGNHEKMMIEYAHAFEKTYPNLPSMNYYHRWINNGGRQTLLSYKIIDVDNYTGKIYCTEDKEQFSRFLNDIKWLESLPLYIELQVKKENRPIVISHAPIAEIWNLKSDENLLEEYALWNRINPSKNVEIFNIFGHTIQKDVNLDMQHYINVDTGCCYVKEGYGKLSAYCIENHSVIHT